MVRVITHTNHASLTRVITHTNHASLTNIFAGQVPRAWGAAPRRVDIGNRSSVDQQPHGALYRADSTIARRPLAAAIFLHFFDGADGSLYVEISPILGDRTTLHAPLARQSGHGHTATTGAR